MVSITGVMSKKTVLAADTDIPLLQAIAIGLRSGGYEVVLAQNADQIVERTETHAPHLLLLDLGLRGALDRVPGRGRAAPLVFMTSAAAERVDPAAHRDAAAVLHKPFNVKSLLTTVAEALGTAVRAARIGTP